MTVNEQILDDSSNLNKKQNSFRIILDLPYDVLLDHYSCAITQNSILIHGRMYISNFNVSFYSNLLGRKIKKRIKYQHISSLYKRNTAMFFPNAIEIMTKDKRFFFSSFLYRDQAFKLIYDCWLNHLGCDEKYSIIANDKFDQIQLFSGEDKDFGIKIAKTLIDKTNLGSDEIIIHKNESNSKPELINNAEDESLRTCVSQKDLAARTKSAPLERKNKYAHDSRSECENDNLENNTTYSSSSSTTEDDTENWMNKIPTNTTCVHTSSLDEKFNAKQIANKSFKSTPVKLFRLLFNSDELSDRIIRNFDLKNFYCGEWELNRDGECCLCRMKSYVMPISTQVGQKIASISIVQHVRQDDKNRILVNSIVTTKDVLMSDCFETHEFYSICKDLDSSLLALNIGVHWKKNAWGLKSKIEKKTYEGAVANWKIIDDFVEESLNNGLLNFVDDKTPSKLQQKSSINFNPQVMSLDTSAPVVNSQFCSNANYMFLSLICLIFICIFLTINNLRLQKQNQFYQEYAQGNKSVDSEINVIERIRFLEDLILEFVGSTNNSYKFNQTFSAKL